ncbi:signal recognition particle-docking protein FtsY [Canicola haemoglobinophilus]|uniref:Signal recognition particle receptor FtsY n=1 Tax=Canicola haemoglobinophilus TaxID=733 RepID=A0A1V4B2G6_9PAST|nr:signal recognition particle-docking protein FtsY [Canicola haemoglobinophilus]OOS01488.1 signal recognition particle-docking protein FtsY [Canicola haemoglobinophilus]STO59942.1 signal recognition particle-docking protein FtsY [Canicola haemoglobinophilus]
MSEEKKKGGFWSWLGLGKKKEETQINSLPEPQEQVIAEQAFLDVEPEIESPEPHIEETLSSSVETVSNEEVIEELAHELEHTEDTTQETESAVEISEVSEEETIEISVEEANEQSLENEISAEQQEDAEINEIPKTVVQEQEKPSEGGFFSRLVKGLLKTKQNIGTGFRSLFLGKKIDDELFEELEEQLLIADIGVSTTTKIINNLTQHASRKQLQDADLLYQQLKVELADILKPVEQPLQLDSSKKPYVILMVGVNGVGKTTTIGKLAHQFQAQGKSVMLAAGDTFRAAAVEQLQVWGERNNIPVIAQSTGSDSASVIFDAMQSAAARNIDVLIADTAGRLQNKNNLMDELKKIVRVMKKYDETAPHEIMLTLDAGTGQNAISQAKLFNEAVGLTGISLTKLDGTAKGGVIFAIADQFNLPIRYIGVGEKIDDLRPFQADEFIDALFVQEEK